MWAPQWVCRKLAEVSPGIRLCWAGRPRKFADELNAGSFGLVRLYKTAHVGTPDNPFTPQEFWDVTMRTDESGRPVMTKVDRGPIFNMKGGLSRDWDPLVWAPIYKVNFAAYEKDWGITTMDVMQGSEKLFRTLREWFQPIRKRLEDSATHAEKNLGSRVDDISRDATDRLWFEANKPGAYGYHYVTKEERIAAEKKIKEKKRGFEGYYNPFKVFR